MLELQEVLACFSLEDCMLALVRRITLLPDRGYLDFDAIIWSLPDPERGQPLAYQAWSIHLEPVSSHIQAAAHSTAAFGPMVCGLQGSIAEPLSSPSAKSATGLSLQVHRLKSVLAKGSFVLRCSRFWLKHGQQGPTCFYHWRSLWACAAACRLH